MKRSLFFLLALILYAGPVEAGTGAGVRRKAGGIPTTILQGAQGPTGADGSAVSSTFTYTFQIGGTAFLSTTTAVMGTETNVAGSTWNVIDVRATCVYPSTVTTTAFNVSKTSATDVGAPWTFVTPDIHVSTNTKFSVVLTTGFPMIPSETYGVRITTVTDGYKGDSSRGCRVIIRAWKQAEQTP